MTINWRDNERKMVDFVIAKGVEMATRWARKRLSQFTAMAITTCALPIDARAGRHDHGEVTGNFGGETLMDQHWHWDISNLFVIGATTFPNSGVANPTSTILALTYRTAEAIADQYLKKLGILA